MTDMAPQPTTPASRRFSLWAVGLQVTALGIVSLGITAVSQLSTPWAVLAIKSIPPPEPIAKSKGAGSWQPQ